MTEGRRLDDSTLRRWLAPPFTALLFLIHPLITLLDPSSPLLYPGTGWHLATGRYVLETGTIPAHDIFSFTARGREWISYYWLFETAGAWLERVGGLPLYTAACVLVYAFLPVLLFRRMLRIGAALLPAFVLTVVAYLVLWSHALARPHIVTYVFFALVLERLDDHRTGRLPPWRLWWLPFLALVWCNMHGGFVAGLVLVGIFLAAAAGRAALLADRSAARETAVLGALLIAMLLATLANPSGVNLHVSIIDHLGQASANYFAEFTSPNFGARSMEVFFFETLVLLVLAMLGLRARCLVWVEVALLVFFLHQALDSLRHMNLFAIVAAPLVARELSAPFARIWPALNAACQRIAVEQVRLRSAILYVPAISVVFLALTLAGNVPFPSDLDGQQLSKGAAEFIAQHEHRFGRVFNTDNVGGSIIYRFWPRLHVFVDDRIFVYGDDFVMERYFAVFFGRKEWRKVLDKYHITSAVLASSASCVTLFREAPDWKLVFEDDRNVIFFRTAP